MTVKKLISTCSSLVVLAACGATFAGGADQFAAPTPPPPPAPVVDYFSGLNLGVFGSFDLVTFNDSVNYWDGAFNDDGDGHDETGYGGVQATFGKVFRDMYYVGVQGYGKFGKADDTHGITDLYTQESITSTESELETMAGVNLKPGIVVGPDRKTLVYLLGGAIWGDTEITASENIIDGDTTSDSGWELGWLAGLGAERFIDDNGNFSVYAQYTFADMDRQYAPNTADGSITQAGTRADDSAFTIGFNYYPGFSFF